MILVKLYSADICNPDGMKLATCVFEVKSETQRFHAASGSFVKHNVVL